MAGIAAVLKAAARAQWRDLRSLQSIAGNNFFLFVLLLMQDPASAAFMAVLIGALVLFPLSADPLRVVPAERLALWPFSRARMAALRAGSVALSPVVWIMAIFLVHTARWGPALQIGLLGLSVQALLWAARMWTRRLPQWNLLRLAPRFPGVFGALVRKDMRQIVCTLDFYMALVFAAVSVAFRAFYPQLDRAAIPVLTLLVVLALSTYAQCLFGLDGASGIMRYRLMPVRGWRILLAKDVAWLLLLLPMVAALSPLTGLTAACATLAVGHHASVLTPVPQQRWRFTSGRLVPIGVVQVVALFAGGMATERFGILWVAGSCGVWLASVFVYGFVWDYRAKRERQRAA